MSHILLYMKDVQHHILVQNRITKESIKQTFFPKSSEPEVHVEGMTT